MLQAGEAVGFVPLVQDMRKRIRKRLSSLYRGWKRLGRRRVVQEDLIGVFVAMSQHRKESESHAGKPMAALH